MKPYVTLRLLESPDASDCRAEGRQTRIAGRINHKTKKAVRRYLKHRDKARCSLRRLIDELMAEDQADADEFNREMAELFGEDI